MKFKLGICQFKPTLLNKKENFEKMKKLVTGVDADLIVFPELATSGYVFNTRDEVFSIADNFDNSETTKMFTDLSYSNNTSFVIGFPEVSNGRLFNSSMLINPNGTKHLYRKIHLFNEEKRWFEPGNLGFTVAKSKNDVLIGLMICFDWIFPESARTLMLKGAQIIAHSSNLVLPWCQQAMITRSIENRIFTATCNRTGKEINDNKEMFFTGMSQVVSPNGNLLFRLNEEEETVKVVEIVTTDADNKNVNIWNNLKEDRKTDFYA